MFLPPRYHNRTPRRRWHVLLAVTVVAAAAAALQFTPAALLPKDRTYAIVGVALGLALGCVLMWIEQRVADR